MSHAEIIGVMPRGFADPGLAGVARAIAGVSSRRVGEELGGVA